MNDGFKQRLVGAIVLVCIGLILWPVIFTDPTEPKLDRSSQIPPMPEFDTYDVPEPTRPEDIAPASERTADSVPPPEPAADQAPASQPQSSASETEPEAESESESASKSEPQGPGLDSRGLPRGWVLQVASFSQEDNAGALKQELQEMGYKAYTRTATTGQGGTVRVYIGPRMSEQAFAEDRPKIDKRFKVESIVVPYEP